ncbi:MAG: hypothetical protein U0350_35870 [Caldilineaceae bacterium]
MSHQNAPTHSLRTRPLLFTFLGLLLTLFSGPLATQAQAAPTPDPTVCYAIADNQGKLPGGGVGDNADQLVSMNRLTGATALIGPTNTLNVEALSFVPSGLDDILYAVDGGTLGAIDLTTGAFTAIGAAGSGNGALGKKNFTVIIGLAYDIQNDTLYATQSKAGQNAILLKIDRQTGAHISDAFGPGQDYLVIPTVFINGQPAQNVDDLAIDPTSGLLYAAVNVNGADGKLIMLDPTTAAVTEVGIFRDTATGATVDNLEGISFDVTGQLYASGGNHGPHPQDNNKLWRIDKQTAAATLVGPFAPGQVDIESLGCLTANPTATPTATTTPTPTDTVTNTPTATATTTATMTPTSTPTNSATPVNTPTATPVASSTPTLAATNSATPPPTSTATNTPTPTTTVEPPTGLDPVGEPSAPQASMQYLPLVAK